MRTWNAEFLPFTLIDHSHLPMRNECINGRSRKHRQQHYYKLQGFVTPWKFSIMTTCNNRKWSKLNLRSLNIFTKTRDSDVLLTMYTSVCDPNIETTRAMQYLKYPFIHKYNWKNQKKDFHFKHRICMLWRSFAENIKLRKFQKKSFRCNQHSWIFRHEMWCTYE